MLTADQIQAEVDEYRRHLDELYGEIRCWITSRYPNAAFSQTRADLSEEATDVYHVQSLDVAVPGLPAVRFVPRGIFMVGAHGRVDVRSRLGREVLVWIESGGPEMGISAQLGDEEHVVSQPLFSNVPEGWAWSDPRGNRLRHLDEETFWNWLFSPLTN